MSAINNLNEYDEDLEAIKRYSSTTSSIHVDQLDPETAQTTLKTQAVLRQYPLSTLDSTNQALYENKIVSAEEGLSELLSTGEKQILAMDQNEICKNIEDGFKELNKEGISETNYLIKIQQVVGNMLALHIQMASNERIQKEGYKSKYTLSNKESGALTKEMGDRGMNFTWLALTLMASQFLLPADSSDKQFLAYFAKEGCTNLNNMYNGETQSKQKTVEGIAQLALAEINAQMNKSSSDASSKQELLKALEEAYQLLKRAAQAS